MIASKTKNYSQSSGHSKKSRRLPITKKILAAPSKIDRRFQQKSNLPLVGRSTKFSPVSTKSLASPNKNDSRLREKKGFAITRMQQKFWPVQAKQLIVCSKKRKSLPPLVTARKQTIPAKQLVVCSKKNCRRWSSQKITPVPSELLVGCSKKWLIGPGHGKKSRRSIKTARRL